MKHEESPIYISSKFREFLKHVEKYENNLVKFHLYKEELFITICRYLASEQMATALEFKKLDPENASDEMKGKLRYANLIRLNEKSLEQAYKNYLKTYIKNAT